MKKMKTIAMASFTILAGCSSTPSSQSGIDVPVTEVERDYVVRDRNPNPGPEWMSDFSKFKRDNAGKGVIYFFGESGDTNDRASGCDLAELQAKKQIANQIASMITNEIAISKAGKILINKDNANDESLRSHFESTVASKSMAFLSGVRIYGNYWEERDYSKAGGKKRVYLCSSVVSIDDLDYQKALRRTIQHTPDVVDDPETKAAVKDALKNAQSEFKHFTSGKTN